MSLLELFVRKPIATGLMTFALLLLGVFAFTQLPVSPLPQAEFPTLRVSANLSGASPEVMATTVATPLENELSAIAGIQEISSSSSARPRRRSTMANPITSSPASSSRQVAAGYPRRDRFRRPSA